MQSYWFIVLICIVASVFIFREAKLRSKAFAVTLDKLMLKIPIIGVIVYNSIMARYGRTLSTTFAAGVPLIDALTSVAGATGNAVYEKAVLQIREEVSTGIQLNQSMRSTNMFPALMVQMTAIGEESGALDEMLEKVAIFYEQAVDDMVSNLTSLLEPMIMAVLGILVGGLMVAMYLPIFQLGQVV